MLNDKAHAEKHLRAMHRELARLEERRRHPPVHALIPPIQRGWKRHFVLTSAARLRPDAATLAVILDCLNTVQYFWRSDFRFTRRQRSHHRGPVVIEQELLAIHWREWEEGPVPPGWRKYFHREFLPLRLLRGWPDWHKTEYRGPWSDHRCRHDWGYAFRFSWWFELKVEKHWLTHYAEVQPGVAGRMAEIERWMDFHRGRERFRRLKGRSDWWSHFERSAHRRCERQIEREMRAHLGFLGNEAADHIPSNNRAGGRGGWDVFSRLVFGWSHHRFFAAVRLEIPRPPNTRHETGQSHRIPAHRARVVGPDHAWTNRFRGGFPGAPPYGPGASAARRRGRPTVRVQANGPASNSGRLSPQKQPGCARHGGPVTLLAVHSHGSESGATS